MAEDAQNPRSYNFGVSHIHDILVYEKDRELLNMLIQFKLNQIKRIKSYMDDYEIAI